MVAPVDICNLALQKLGEAPITSLDESTPIARQCAAAYEPMRDRELRAHPWSFALKRVTLAADLTAPDFGPTASFTLPADFLRLHPDHEYEEESDWTVEGRKLLSSRAGDALTLRYIYRVEDTTEFDPLFVDALAARIAWQLCEIVTQSNTKKADARADYQSVIREARAVNAIEKRSAEPPTDDWILVRR